MNNKQKIIIITGPTATGKTEIGIELALKYNGRIVSCDSRQVYRYMDIGTAKPYKEQLGMIQHYMIDIITPSEYFSVAKYIEMADEHIKSISNNGFIPFIVGGTGLYIKALVHGIAGVPYISPEIRNGLKEEQRLYGNKFLYDRLKAVDPEGSVHIKPNDSYRIIRALEVFDATGITMHTYLKEHGFSDKRYDYLYIVLYYADKQAHISAIENRVDGMINRGLIDEAGWLIDNGYGADLPSMKTVGYKEMTAYLDGIFDKDTAINLIKQHTKAYVKRQITWFKAVKDAIWIDVRTDRQRLDGLIDRFVYAKDT